MGVLPRDEMCDESFASRLNVMGSGCGMRRNQRERRKSAILFEDDMLGQRFILDFVVLFISLLWTDLLNCSLKFGFFILGRSSETAQQPTENKLIKQFV